MSLGASKGAVVFGRPLDLTIQVRLDGPLDESSNCFSAEIFQGDARFDSSRVRVDVKAAANPLEALIRIRSTATITEPWAKVILRSNCGIKMSRQYDFLTDFVSDLPANLSNPRLPVVASTARDAQEPAAGLPPLASLTAPTTDKPLNAKSVAIKQKSATASPSKEAKSATAALTSNTDNIPVISSNTPAVRSGKLKSTNTLTAKASVTAEGRSRLKMETFDLADEQQVMLKMSTALLAPVAFDTPANAQALAQAAAVWRALNAKPEDVAADAQKLQATAAELQSIKSTALKEQTNLQERLRMAEEKKFANPLVYGLLALLVLTLAGLAWMGLLVRKNAQTGYVWLDDKIVPVDAQPLPSMEAAEPVFVNTVNTASAFVAAEEAPATSIEEGPAEAASAKHPEIPEALVITPTEVFMLPITQPESEQQATTPPPPLEVQEIQVDFQLPLPQKKAIAPLETLNIDLDFSKISPPVAHGAARTKNKHADDYIDNHIEFYGGDAYAKAGQAEQASERKLKSPPPLPKSVVSKSQKPANPVAADHKSNLIDFESFATPPAPSRPSRFTS